MSLTKDQFESLSADEKWKLYENTKVDRDAFVELSEKFSAALEKLEACKMKISALEDRVAVTTNVNNVLSDSVKKIQKKLNRLEQYGRRENLVFSGFPDNCTNTEEKVTKLLEKMGCPVAKSEIAACHPLKKKGQAIIRFINRKSAEKILISRKKLRNLDTSDIWG